MDDGPWRTQTRAVHVKIELLRLLHSRVYDRHGWTKFTRAGSNLRFSGFSAGFTVAFFNVKRASSEQVCSLNVQGV